MKTIRVLFLCIHNSARSQMAQGLLNKLGKDRFQVDSAGLELGPINPHAVQVMAEIGIDISQNKSKSVFEFIRTTHHFNYVITLCDDLEAERCPVFPGFSNRLHWSFPDPAKVSGTEDEKLAYMRNVRDQIQHRIVQWIKELDSDISSKS